LNSFLEVLDRAQTIELTTDELNTAYQQQKSNSINLPLSNIDNLKDLVLITLMKIPNRYLANSIFQRELKAANIYPLYKEKSSKCRSFFL